MVELVKVLIISGGRTVVVLGVLASLFLSIGYLFAPGMMKGLSGAFNQIFEIDDWMLAHRIALGVLFILVTVFLLGILYLVK